jgi:hypothetical protein
MNGLSINAVALALGVILIGFMLLVWVEQQRQSRRLMENVERLRFGETDLRRHQMENEERLLAEQAKLRQQQLDEEKQRREEDREREELREYRERMRQEEEALRQAVGPGSGGYIVIDLPDDRRPLFHDLLKGFEEYARLKGYSVSFSIDSTLKDKIAFKFTIANDVVNVGPGRVREDFQEYVRRVETGDDLSDLPVVTSIEEHNLLVTILKNRISFLQHSYNLQKNATDFYMGLLRNLPRGAVLPAATLVVQTGGLMDSRRYISTSSQKMIRGDSNTLADSSVDASITIGNSFNERRAQVDFLAKLIEEVRAKVPDAENTTSVVRDFERVKDELEEQEQPDRSRIRTWLERAKSGIQALALGKETLELVNQVLKSFGVSILPGA